MARLGAIGDRRARRNGSRRCARNACVSHLTCTRADNPIGETGRLDPKQTVIQALPHRRIPRSQHPRDTRAKQSARFPPRRTTRTRSGAGRRKGGAGQVENSGVTKTEEGIEGGEGTGIESAHTHALILSEILFRRSTYKPDLVSIDVQIAHSTRKLSSTQSNHQHLLADVTAEIRFEEEGTRGRAEDGGEEAEERDAG